MAAMAVMSYIAIITMFGIVKCVNMIYVQIVVHLKFEKKDIFIISI